MDTNSPNTGGEEVEAEKGWMMGGWVSDVKNFEDWMDGWMVSERRCCKCLLERLNGDQRVCWGVLPVCEGGGDPGQRGWWRGGPLSSSPPPVPGSAVQTAPPAPWLTPAEPPRSHTAPYTLHSPKGKEGGVTHIHTASSALQHKRGDV